MAYRVPDERFHSTARFTGILFPRWDDKPDGEQLQSMVKCVCGQWWKDHRLVDGACPVKEKPAP
jgi:hypothetical protein